ncbi:Ig-like domain-containing protein [Leptospira terpstrae]|uniref:SbsA Ig-like domain-containing protein n=1 Tax=Leptospira terpstrae serovar Hualin str. LT 11-33 = ATCC 700639 TaxID=1257025 RepID=N1VY25_9LEPT|nr:Ig-like domain-containing protein [Leptospira terpstrae]EMY61945.1 hypothetical protein LEP1GSC203_3755 [Leptospira terpstrae serovar Hualin str. LT 11-33 = ATCC 700639]
MNRNLSLPTLLSFLSLWMILGNCYFNPAVQLVVNPTVEEEQEVAGAGLLAVLASPPSSPYFFLVSSIPADGEDLTSSITSFSFTFSEELDINASNPGTWITENIIQTQTIFFLPTVGVSERKIDLSLPANALVNAFNYSISFGPGINVKSGRALTASTKISFTCSGCPGL